MINWRKGLFRFWIVIATIWIISIVVLNIDAYKQASKKESRLKQIVSEIINPEKALNKINTEFPESKQYGSIVNKNFIDMGPVEKSMKPPGMFDEFLPKDKPDHKSYVNDSKSKLIPLDEFIQGIVKEICDKAENDRKDKLYNILIISIIPPIILLAIGSAILWALRGFKT